MTGGPFAFRRRADSIDPVRAFVVDAFTDRPFRGNPAGVVLLGPSAADAAWMQSVAAELRHSETAFVGPPGPGGVRPLRWFTPATEVDLCGHATLATAHVLATVEGPAPIAFDTRSGVLRAESSGDGAIRLDFPAKEAVPIDEPAGLARALGTDLVAAFRCGTDDVLVEVADAAAVAGLVPDIDAVAAVDCRGVIVTAVADAGADHDFVSRFLAPRVGVPEDPVTGSAHCALAPFWSARLGRPELVGVQLSPRGGRVGTMLRGDRVLLAGRAVTVLDGELAV